MLLHRLRCCLLLLLAICLSSPASAAAPETQPVEGLADGTPAVHALQGARVFVAPGRIVEGATIVIRDGMIVAVAAQAEAPDDARVWDLAGKTVYPGFIDAYGETTVDSAAARQGAPYWNRQVTPQRNVADHYQSDSSLDKKLRGQGITARLVAPSNGIFKGSSALVLTGDEPNRLAIIQPHVAQHLRLTVSRGRGRDEYPNSPMGAVALARQAMYDAGWYRRAWVAHRADSSLARPERNDALEVLQTYLESSQPIVADAPNELYFLRADRYAREFGLNIIVRGSGDEYRRLEAIKSAGRAVIVPLDFPRAPNVGSAESALNVRLEQLMDWDLAPENAGRLAQAGVKIALTSHGLRDQGTFLQALRRAVRRGLQPEAALRALTATPAELFGAGDVLGTVEAGKLANLVVADGDIFDKDTKILETWVRGRRYEHERPPLVDVLGRWQIELEQGPRRSFTIRLRGKPNRLSGVILAGEADDESEDIKLTRAGLSDARFSCTFPAKSFGYEGVARLTAVVSASGEASESWIGHVIWPDDSRVGLSAQKLEPEQADAQQPAEEPEEAATQDETQEPAAEPAEGEGEQQDEDKENEKGSSDGPASFAVHYPLGAFGRESPPEQPQHVLLQGATVWTCGGEGVLEEASVLIGGGRILAVGTDLDAPEDALVVDARGKHITPGIIDCHSHMATDGGVNESSQAITAEVRIGDFVDCDDIAIYQQLAGGVTSANILHGSANPIGGQNQVIKLRWGAVDEAMKFAEAPEGIKFALGENVKQSNWGDSYNSRYPQTRMGVDEIIRDAFRRARDYDARRKSWERTHRGLPPRRDLELDALAEVLAGSRWVHCHSYRQDEILALLRTCEEFGIRIGTLQHILEGYKVADAMARHGAMGSAFSDWWAYKIEVWDAIPYAGALMHQAGVVVSFNSDDRELARHLNQEAAKATKYGGVPPEEALKFVTLNAALQLRIDQYVGSLEPGKHADLVVWSGPPMSNYSRCEQTWIDGRKYFDIEEDRQLRERDRQIRTTLVQKILSSGQTMKSPDEADEPDENLWPREDIFCHHHDEF